MNTQFVPTKRTRLKRLSKRASYERKIIYQILNEAFICHVGFISDGQPVVIPTAYGRAEDVLYIHGSVASRMLRALADGIRVCVTVTLVDGLVLARSAFHHSMNYRSIVVFGQAYVVRDAMEKAKALPPILRTCYSWTLGGSHGSPMRANSKKPWCFGCH